MGAFFFAMGFEEFTGSLSYALDVETDEAQQQGSFALLHKPVGDTQTPNLGLPNIHLI